MAEDEQTQADGAGATAINLRDAILPDLMYRLAHNEPLTDEQRGDLLSALMAATGATIPKVD